MVRSDSMNEEHMDMNVRDEYASAYELICKVININYYLCVSWLNVLVRILLHRLVHSRRVGRVSSVVSQVGRNLQHSPSSRM